MADPNKEDDLKLIVRIINQTKAELDKLKQEMEMGILEAGPIGEPRIAIVHGGERIVSSSGESGDMQALGDALRVEFIELQHIQHDEPDADA